MTLKFSSDPNYGCCITTFLTHYCKKKKVKMYYHLWSVWVTGCKIKHILLHACPDFIITRVTLQMSLSPCASSCLSPCINEGVGCGRLAGYWTQSARPRKRCQCGACWWCVHTACRPDKARSSSVSWLEARGPRWSTVWAHCPPSGCCPAQRWSVVK